MKRFVSIALAVFMFIPLFCGCTDNKNDVSSGNSETDVSDIIVSPVASILINSSTLDINTVNKRSDNGIMLFDRDYELLTLGERYSDMIAVTVKLTEGKYTVYSVSKASNDHSGIIIPVNGFVIVAPSGSIDDINPKTGNTVSIVNGYISPSYEVMSFCTAVPNERITSRRINMLYPENATFEDGKIYYVNLDNDVTVPENSVAVLFSGSAAMTVSKILEKGSTIPAKSKAMIFCGDYNMLYARTFYSEGTKFNLLNTDMLNNYTDKATISTANGILSEINDKNINSISKEDGIYLYSSDNSSLITNNKTNGFIDYVVMNGAIVYIGEKNKTTLIPTNGGYIFTVAGSENIEKANSLKLGDKVNVTLFAPPTNPDKYVKIGSYEFEFTAINTARDSVNKAVLYNRLFGTSTKTQEGIEFTFIDNKLTAINKSGDSEIPDGGYVLSIENSTSAASKAKNISVDDYAAVSVSGKEYGYDTYGFNSVNGARLADMLIIYDGNAGTKTSTNIYGVEIIVNADGIMTAIDYNGNASIPTGGFVLSGHGTSMTLLESIFSIGMKVSYDPAAKTFSCFKTPELGLLNAAYVLEDVNTSFENAKKGFYSIDYLSVSEKLDKLDGMYNSAKEYFEKGDIDKATGIAYEISSEISSLQYCLYESKPVENRAAWYRANEKSDAEVLETIKKVVATNVNALYIETWYNGKVICYVSDERIEHNAWVHGDFDVLEAFCRYGKEYGIEIHIWVENFFIGVPGDSLVESTKGHHCIDKNGQGYYPNMYGNFVFLNPYERENRDLVLGIYRDIIRKYDIDGIHLDYIRFSEPNGDADFGYNDNIISGFQAEYNTTVDPHNLSSSSEMWKNWCKFRENIINSFVSEVYELVQAEKPSLIVSSACYPDFVQAPNRIYQNFRDWVSNGYMNEVFSMSYGSNIEWPVNNAKSFIAAIGNKAYYSIGVSAFESVQTRVLIEQMKQAVEAGASGVSLFSWGSFINHKLGYAGAMASGIFSKPATQTYKYSDTVLAGMQSFYNDIDAVYAYLVPDKTDFYSELKTKINDIIQSAKIFDYKTASSDSKLSYCNETVEALEALKTYIKNNAETNMAKAMNADIEYIVKALKISIYRLS